VNTKFILGFAFQWAAGVDAPVVFYACVHGKWIRGTDRLW